MQIFFSFIIFFLFCLYIYLLIFVKFQERFNILTLKRQDRESYNYFLDHKRATQTPRVKKELVRNDACAPFGCNAPLVCEIFSLTFLCPNRLHFIFGKEEDRIVI